MFRFTKKDMDDAVEMMSKFRLKEKKDEFPRHLYAMYT